VQAVNEMGVGRGEEVCRKGCPYIRQLANYEDVSAYTFQVCHFLFDDGLFTSLPIIVSVLPVYPSLSLFYQSTHHCFCFTGLLVRGTDVANASAEQNECSSVIWKKVKAR